MLKFKSSYVVGFIVSSLLLTTNLLAQNVKFGIKGGINTSFVDQELSELEGQTIGEIVQDANFGYHGGIFTRFQFGPMLLQPELLITSKKDLDIPILVGLKAGPVRINGGPMVRMAFDHNKVNQEGGTEESTSFFGSSKYGAQAGIGFDLKKVAFDIRYETNLTALGDEAKLFGKPRSLNSGPPQISLSLGYSF